MLQLNTCCFLLQIINYILEVHSLFLDIDKKRVYKRRGRYAGLLRIQDPTQLICEFYNPLSGILSSTKTLKK